MLEFAPPSCRDREDWNPATRFVFLGKIHFKGKFDAISSGSPSTGVSCAGSRRGIFPGFGSTLLDDALMIAIDYLKATGQAEDYTRFQRVAAAAVLAEWRKGVRHQIRLSNAAIVAVQNEEAAKRRRST